MRNIELKKIQTQVGKELDYKEELLSTLKYAPVEGLSVEEVRLRIKIIDRIEAQQNNVLLEENEFKSLSTLVKNMKWRLVDPATITFTDDIINTEEVDPNADDRRGN